MTLTLLAWTNLFGQKSSKLKMIIDLSGTDTLLIQKFDENQRLVFWKSFPQYGMSQILTYSYANKLMMNYTWSHSKYGFIISEYTYDTLLHTRTTHSYESKKDAGAIENLMSFQNDTELKKSKQYQEVHQGKNGFLKAIAFYRDTFLINEVEFESNGDTGDLTVYSYKDNLLKKKRVTYKNKHFNDLVYDYDKYGNEIQWSKIFDNTDTAYVFKKSYIDNNMVEKIEFSRTKLEAITKYEYSDGLLKSEKDYDDSGKLKRQKQYYYHQNKTLSKIVGYDRTSYYIYD